MTVRVLEGDCVALLLTLPAASVDAVVTSPPYAQQRAGFYDGVSEADYPAWTVTWMDGVRRVLKPTGSVLINIREHVRDGEIGDYVHRTRLALRADGWRECDELIWVKPASPPVGHAGRPRRSWERILWFSPVRQPWCDPYASGAASEHIGITPSGHMSRATASWLHGGQAPAYSAGMARTRDYALVPICAPTGDGDHPAAYPPALAAWMARLVCPPGGMVLDPFAGSGSTGVACVQEGFDFIGMEKEPAYCESARRRLAAAERQLRLFPVLAEVPVTAAQMSMEEVP